MGAGFVISDLENPGELNRLVLDRCVCMGHSFGAASSLSACVEYPSLFNACVLLDAWLYPVERQMYPATVQPVLVLNASKWQWPRNVRRMQRLLATATTAINDNKTPPTEAMTTAPPPQQSQDGAATTAATTATAPPPSDINTDSRIMFTLKEKPNDTAVSRIDFGGTRRRQPRPNEVLYEQADDVAAKKVGQAGMILDMEMRAAQQTLGEEEQRLRRDQLVQEAKESAKEFIQARRKH
ncbi:hypothetical protein niasHS_004598 [Heterodera schachtii]|uniref:1-alkyl-2-acetylglycerophosphocholine esterase n=1 Tax=Heterodera schachtii TaxID=97005 RepID=A0ABD2JQT0_HETSC